MESSGPSDFQCVSTTSNGMAFSRQRSPSMSSTGYYMDPPPPYPGPPPPPPSAPLNQSAYNGVQRQEQPFYVWSASLPGQVPIAMEPPRPCMQYPHPLPLLPPHAPTQLPPLTNRSTVLVLSNRLKPRPQGNSRDVSRERSGGGWLCAVVLTTICCLVQGNIPILFCLLPSIFFACKANSPEAPSHWKIYSKYFCCCGVLEYLIIIGGGAGYAIYYIVKHNYIHI